MLRSSLLYSCEPMFEITRKKRGKGFQFLHKQQQPVTDKETLERIQALVIPPAWTDVHICNSPHGHIQATGIDAKGRKQYIYHSEWSAQQQQHKFDRLIRFGEVLPELRQVIESDMRAHGLGRDRVLATVVWLLQNTFIRVGNQEYAKQNQSYGLTTLREKHVEVEEKSVTFSFKGKSGVFHEVEIQHPRVRKTIQQCIEVPGYELFQYLNDDGQRHVVDSRDVNEYIHQKTGEEFSAKDFRTWGGTTLAANSLYTMGKAENPTALKKHLTTAVKEVASHLRNTPTICRKYYIHPTVLHTYQEDVLIPHFSKELKTSNSQAKNMLLPEEYATWTLLQKYAQQ